MASNQSVAQSKGTGKGGVTPEKGGPMGGHNEYRRTGKVPTPENTGAKGKATTPQPC